MKKLVDHTTITFFILLVLGCVPEYNIDDIEIEIPNKWEYDISDNQNVTGVWWGILTDSTIISFIEKVKSQNKTLNNIIYRNSIAYQTARIQGTNIYPTLNGLLSGNKSVQNLATFGFSESFLPENQNQDSGVDDSDVISFNSETYGLQLSTQWEIDIWGRALNARRAALKDYEAMKYELSYIGFSTLVQSVKTFIQAEEAYGQVEIAKVSYNNLVEIRDMVKDRYEKGVKSSLDYRLAETSVAIAEVQIEVRQAQANNIFRVLNVLQGQYPSNKFIPTNQLIDSIPSISKGIPADLLKRRPDIKSAILKIEAEGMRLGQNKRNLLPGIMLNASAGTSTKELSEVFNDKNGIWNAGLSVASPLFNQKKLRLAIKVQESIRNEAIENLYITLLEAFTEVEGLIELEESYNNQLSSFKIAQEQSKNAYQLARERYDKGITTLELVLNSQKQYNDIRSQYLELKRRRLNNRLDLILALGGNEQTTLLNFEMEEK